MSKQQVLISKPDTRLFSAHSIALSVAALAVGVITGRAGRSEAPVVVSATPACTDSRNELPMPALASAKPLRHPTAIHAGAPGAAAAEHDNAEEEQLRHEQRSKEATDLLMTRFQRVDGAFRGTDPEAVVNHVRHYQAGLMEGVLLASPELTDALSQQVERALCAPDAKDTQLMVMSRLVGDVPELATSAGFDCIFNNRSKEDLVLLTALEAWRQTGMRATPGIARVNGFATDPRTKQLLTMEPPQQAASDEPLPLKTEPTTAVVAHAAP